MNQFNLSPSHLWSSIWTLQLFKRFNPSQLCLCETHKSSLFKVNCLYNKHCKFLWIKASAKWLYLQHWKLNALRTLLFVQRHDSKKRRMYFQWSSHYTIQASCSTSVMQTLLCSGSNQWSKNFLTLLLPSNLITPFTHCQ